MRNWSRRSLSDAPRPKAAVVSSPEPRSTRSVGADKAKLTRLEREEKLVHSIVQRLAASVCASKREIRADGSSWLLLARCPTPSAARSYRRASHSQPAAVSSCSLPSFDFSRTG